MNLDELNKNPDAPIVLDGIEKNTKPIKNKSDLEWIHFYDENSCTLFRNHVAHKMNVVTGNLCCGGKGCVIKQIHGVKSRGRAKTDQDNLDLHVWIWLNVNQMSGLSTQ